MPNPTDTTNDAAAGRAAGERFARSRADAMDRLTLREAQDADPGAGTLLDRLFAAYADDMPPPDVAETLFGDTAARPSDVYVAAFIAAALPILEDAFCKGDEDDEDEALSGADPNPLGSTIARLLDWCLETGMSFPMTLVWVSRTGDLMATRYTGPGAAGELIADRVKGLGMDFPMNGLVTDEAGGAAHVRMDQDGTTAQLLAPSESPPLRS
jgi:hypothetical protein